MTSKLKALGLAFVAITALSAVASSAAQAGTLDIGANPAVITGESYTPGEHLLSLTPTVGAAISFKCPTATFEGTVHQQVPSTGSQQEVTDIEVRPTYSGHEGKNCIAFGVAAQFITHGCTYTLTGGQTNGTHHPANTATVDITGCTQVAGQPLPITVKTAVCTLDIPQQNHLSHVIGTNVAGSSPHHVTLDATVTGITVRQTGAGCPDGNNHVSTTGAFQGSTTVKAYKDAGAGAVVTLHSHQYTKLNHGAQVNLTST